jgi:hypothetical protein
VPRQALRPRVSTPVLLIAHSKSANPGQNAIDALVEPSLAITTDRKWYWSSHNKNDKLRQ